MDLTTLTDEQLEGQRLAVLTEQERRLRLAATPAQVAQMAERYIADGGDVADLHAAIPDHAG